MACHHSKKVQSDMSFHPSLAACLHCTSSFTPSFRSFKTMEIELPEDVKAIMTTEQLALLLERRKAAAAAEIRELGNATSRVDVQFQAKTGEHDSAVVPAASDVPIACKVEEDLQGSYVQANMSSSPGITKVSN